MEHPHPPPGGVPGFRFGPEGGRHVGKPGRNGPQEEGVDTELPPIGLWPPAPPGGWPEVVESLTEEEGAGVVIKKKQNG